MLSASNIIQILEEHQVQRHEPEVLRQHPIPVALTTARRRGAMFHREPTLMDGLLVCWMLCWPFFPQSDTYTQFIRSARRELFQDKSVDEAVDNARRFFLDDLLLIEANQLTEILSRDGALSREPESAGNRIQLFDVNMLRDTPRPELNGWVYLRQP